MVWIGLPGILLPEALLTAGDFEPAWFRLPGVLIVAAGLAVAWLAFSGVLLLGDLLPGALLPGTLLLGELLGEPLPGVVDCVGDCEAATSGAGIEAS